MLVSFCYGVMEIIDGLVRVVTLGIVSTRLPMWFLTRVEIRHRSKLRKNNLEE